MEAISDSADVEMELVYELDYNQPGLDPDELDELDDPWFAPSEDDLVAAMFAATTSPRRSWFPVALVVGCAFLVAACVTAGSI